MITFIENWAGLTLALFVSTLMIWRAQRTRIADLHSWQMPEDRTLLLSLVMLLHFVAIIPFHAWLGGLKSEVVWLSWWSASERNLSIAAFDAATAGLIAWAGGRYMRIEWVVLAAYFAVRACGFANLTLMQTMESNAGIGALVVINDYGLLFVLITLIVHALRTHERPN